MQRGKATTILLAIASIEIVSCDAASASVAERADASSLPPLPAGPVPEDGGIEASRGVTASAFDASPFATVDANNDATADSGAVTMADSSPAGTVDATVDADPTENADASPDADAGTGSTASTGPDASDCAAVDAVIEATADVRDGVAAASDAEAGLADAGDATIDDPYGYSEAKNGSFSSVNTAPTAVRVTIGSSLVTGVVGGGSPDGQLDDYFEIVVPAGAALTSIVLTQDVSTSGSGDYTFFAVAAGTSISSSETTAAGMLGWVLFYPGMIGTDLLPTMGQAGNGATGFSPPLGPGTYSFRVQDNDGSNAVTYQLKLVLSAQ